MTQLKPFTDLFACDLPEGAKDVFVYYKPAINQSYLDWMVEENYSDAVIMPGEWQLLFTTKTATERDWKGVVGTIHVEHAPSPYNDMAGGFSYAFIDYENPGDYAGWQGDAGAYSKASQSGHSLLKSNGLNPEENRAILKQVK